MKRGDPPLVLGAITMTAGVDAWLKEVFVPATFSGVQMIEPVIGRAMWVGACVGRHQAGHWGEIDAEDWESNNNALELGGRILSAYKTLPPGLVLDDHSLWIITEHDRSVTTVMWPKEY